ncbi:MAG: K+/H+ antiporter subunit F [Comamonadaceae bacterium]|nr:K+/H+ antiporter subunit F [Burkholderiales bacterium]MEB2349419.1 K+/H+ antiporter subunit F [Comamonadaceae bacterium]
MTFLPWALPIALVMLALAMLLCLLRMMRGPAAQDRVMALDALYLNAMLLIIVLCVYWSSLEVFEAALLIASLGFVGTASLAKFLLRGEIIE